MTGKIQVTPNAVSDKSSMHEMPQQQNAPKSGLNVAPKTALQLPSAIDHMTVAALAVWSQRHLERCCMIWLLQKSTPNLDGAFKFLNTSVGSAPWTAEVSKGIEESAGVGVVVTPEQIKDTVAKHIEKVKADMLEQRSATAHCRSGYASCDVSHYSTQNKYSLNIKLLLAVLQCFDVSQPHTMQ